jgi:CCR4-NOT transcription complex subunit 7/8
MKLLTCKPLPPDETEFFDLVRMYFPVIYDIKYLMQWKNLKGGLSDMAEYLAVREIYVTDTLSFLLLHLYISLYTLFYS